MKFFKYIQTRWNRYYSITLFDSRSIEHGGHGYTLARIINNKLLNKVLYIDYFGVGVCTKPQLGYHSTWYDGQHHSIWLGFLCINWEGSPHGIEIDWMIPRIK